jgi:hypothetical protein
LGILAATDLVKERMNFKERENEDRTEMIFSLKQKKRKDGHVNKVIYCLLDS